jgi:hypothetical protein
LVVDALVNAKAAWLGVQKPIGHAVFSNVVPECDASAVVEIDAVVALRREAGGRSEFHGIEVKGRAARAEVLHRQVRTMAEFADFVWVATNNPHAEELIDMVPATVGIFIVTSLGIRVIREALKGRPVRAESLLRALVLTSHGR